jgi:hypothetical protein
MAIETDDTDSFQQAVVVARGARPFARGEVIAVRFVIDHLAGSGGMGAVYRATDRSTGEPAAVKVMKGGGSDRARFAQEAQVLAELQHPAIVRYVAHGPLADDQIFLAMEWLEGEDLAHRLARAPLAIADALVVVRRAAEGLAAAHRRGVVHRDVKPSNLFLTENDPARTKLLDFGVARPMLGPRVMTQTGAIVGTVGYMAPEQARGERDIDPRADVFALGCVLFQCLTGQPAFAAQHAVAMLAKVLFEEAPRASALSPGVPADLDDLLARMLAKDKLARPGDADALLAELERLGPAASETPPPVVRLTVGENRIVCVLLADSVDRERVQPLSAPFGADVAQLADGTLVATLGMRGSATDHAAQMASLALAIRDTIPGARIALATGRAETTDRQPVGPVIDRAAALLGEMPGEIRIDSVSRSLLEARFELRGDQLIARRASDEARMLLGKSTPCVGRDKELAILDATLAECIAEPIARVVLVTAPPGTGKSRLRIEFVESARRSCATVLLARTDPVSAGSSFGIARQLVRGAAGLREGDPPAAQHAQLHEHLARCLHGDELDSVTAFLGELVGAPSPAPPVMLRTARGEPAIMGEWMRRSFEQWLLAESAAGPLLVVIEDLQWGDAPSVAYLDGALRRLAERPVLVLALARPEVRDLFPRPWADFGLQEIQLGGLSRRAAERLVRTVLGDQIAGDVVTRLVDRVGGNAYYLEELIRRVAEGGGDDLPETILAMVESRLERVEPEGRRVLRAASTFGEVFWAGGVCALLGGEAHASEVRAWLAALADRELLATRSTSKFGGEAEYAFRHGLLREASYAMLTDADRATAHRLAAAWLETAGEKDALVLAEHFERGGEPLRAVPWLLAAVKAAYDGVQFATAIELAKRGIANGATGELLGAFRRVQGSSAALLGEWQLVRDWTTAAIANLPRGGDLWVRALAARLIAECHVGDRTAATTDLEQMVTMDVDPAPTGHSGWGLMLATHHALYVGRTDLASALLPRIARMHQRVDPSDEPIFAAYAHVARLTAAWMGAEPPGASSDLSDALAVFERRGDFNGRVAAHGVVGFWRTEAGDAQALQSLHAARAVSERAGAPHYVCHIAYFHARACAFLGRFDDVVRDAPLVPDGFHARVGIAGLVAWALAEAGELDAAERAARAALARTDLPFFTRIPLAALALVALARGRGEQAIELADAGLAEATDRMNDTSLLRLIRARASHALGDADAACAAIADARDRLLRIAATHDDPGLRDSYLTNITPHAHTLALAREWQIDS